MSKNVWITGASSGIGKALAIKFAREGWQVAASARRENLLKDLKLWISVFFAQVFMIQKLKKN